MEWIIVGFLGVIVWILFDIANKIHNIDRDVDVIRNRLIPFLEKHRD
jgi:hypothetical protein